MARALTEDEISEGIQLASAATAHWLAGDHTLAFKTVTYAENFPAVVYGLLAVSAVAVAGSGKPAERFFKGLALDQQQGRLRRHQEGEADDD